jgi:CBS domain-containing protein/PII-like signaling protein
MTAAHARFLHNGNVLWYLVPRMHGKRMTIFLGESDQWHHRPLYMAILEHLKTAGCAGATVTRGIAGFGAQSQIKTANILTLSVDLPVVITAIDAAEKIERVLPEISTMLGAGLIVVDDTEVYFHSAAFRGGFPDLQVGDVMSTEPEAVTPDTPIADVVERLVSRDYTALPVVDGAGQVIGVIGDTDLLRAGLTGVSVSVHKVIGPDLVREQLSALKSAGTTVRQAMTTPAVTIVRTLPLADAAHLMHARNLKRLPVVDDSGKLVGVLGRLDVLRSVATGYTRRTTAHSVPLPQAHRTVTQIMEQQVPTVAESAPLADVVGKLLDSAVKRVVVLDDAGKLAGIITDTDIVGRVDPAQRPGLLTLLRSRWSAEAHRQVQRAYGQRAADVMTRPVITVRDTASAIDALTLTVERHIKRLPVIDAEGHVVGMVSRPALLAAALEL